VDAKDLDQLAINTIRFLSVDAVQHANSGHPGMPLGAAPMAYVLWDRFLRHNPRNPSWFNRDRFVLSAGHASMLLYSLLHLTGYDVPLAEIKRFRQWGSITAGHPERGLTPGVEVTTGPLGQGFANAVGFAIAEAHLAARYNRPGLAPIDHTTYVLVSDGDLMEGVSAEAASLAGQLRLGKLICLYDNNHVTLSASTRITFSEDCSARFAAYGWHTQSVEDGNDLDAIDNAIRSAKGETERPSLILVRTVIGYGSPNKHGTFEVHGSPLGEEEVRLTKQNLGWPPSPPFLIPTEVSQHFQRALAKASAMEAAWNAQFDDYRRSYPEPADELMARFRGELPPDWQAAIPTFAADSRGMATRVAGAKVVEAFYKRIPGLFGGSADLDPSTFTTLKGEGDFESSGHEAGDLQGSAGGGWSYAGRNLHFGIREHAMGSIANGLAAHGAMLPFTATFLTFSDYMRPPIRLAALMDLHVVYVFTHDSVGMGEDGPTHQPIEHLASLRAIPHLIVIRPSDANETAVAWQVAIETSNHPVALVLTRQSVPILDRTHFAAAAGLRRGAYVLSDPPRTQAQLILIASGSEVALIVEAEQRLRQQNVAARLVSMPSWDLFEAQPREYRDAVLPPSIRARLAVEAGVSQGWQRYVEGEGDILSIDRFGASAPGPEVLRQYGFTAENVCEKALAVWGRNRPSD
jgi:transketolase